MIVINQKQYLTLAQALQDALQHHQAERLEEAENHYSAILLQAPEYADACHLAGVCSHQRGDHQQAIQRIQHAIALCKENPGYYNNLGIALKALKRYDEAITSVRQALKLKPEYAAAHVTLGNILKDLGRLEEATGSYRLALRYKPDLAECHNNLANVLKCLGRYDEAVKHYQAALNLKPMFHVLHHNLGNTLKEQGYLEQAVAHYKQALHLRPDYPDALLHLGHAQKACGQPGEALTCYQRALTLKPGDPEIRCALIGQMQALCLWDGLEPLLDQQRCDVTDLETAPISPFSFLCTPSSAYEQSECAKKWARVSFEPFTKMRTDLGFDHPRKAKPRLRIGYISADFHQHATAYLIAELFELHSRERFEVVAYSYGHDDGSIMRKRLATACDRFIDLRNVSLLDSARLIHADQIDILVDLKGYTRHARSEIMALKPAPIQAHFLGYPGTLGTDFVDYFITDHFISPSDQAQHFSEKLVFLPDSYQINDRQRQIAEPGPSRRDCGLPESGMVFCCLNNPYKIMPVIFEIWMRVLKAVPDSVLWLLQGDPIQTENLIREANRHGVAQDRLVFAPRLALPNHLARYQLADLFLDTFPVNAHTTASDALWAGLPLLTCSGETFVSRVAGSLLHNVGLPELAVSNLGEYEELALRLGQNQAELKRLRQRLVRNRLTCPLFDSHRFTRHLEHAYGIMWQSYLAGAPAEAIEVPHL